MKNKFNLFKAIARILGSKPMCTVVIHSHLPNERIEDIRSNLRWARENGYVDNDHGCNYILTDKWYNINNT